ncbi:MAG TPA: Ig-like domain-containing protein, partial [Verrucomicrobiae bacterium]|nr:Ig-like domain-containing protein [Verrucomicrobiae bacterium]
ANAIGTAKITVTVNDGQTKNPTAKCTFTVSVTAVNQAPTLNPIADLTINKNSGNQSVDLSGITSGAANEKQKLKVTAISANPALIPDPTISYKSPNSTGTLTFAPVTNAVGTTSITVTVNDGGKNNNTIARTFNVTILNPASSNIVISIQPAAAVNQETGAQIMIVKAPVILKSNAFTFTNTIILTGQPASVPDDEPAASAVLGTPNYLNGQFTLTVTGTAGSNYAVQASSNLQDWVSIETNASPFIFVDVNAAQFNQRFYRAVYLPPVLQ